MTKTFEQSVTLIDNRWQDWIKMFFVAVSALLLAFIVMMLWVSYQQILDDLHPARQSASGDLLRANGIDFQDIQLITEDNVKLSAWYTAPQNGVVILVAHGYGDKRAEDYHALFARHGYGVGFPCPRRK